MQRTLPVIAVNGAIDAQVSPLDRGFAYGDGIFETCKLQSGKIPFWPLHKARLLSACNRLSIPVEISLLEAQLANVLSVVCAEDLKNAIVKITVTRGEGGRGYRWPELVKPTIVIGIFPAVAYPPHYFSAGVNVRLCEHRLGSNAGLAGLKHLNRLDQVLARAEWSDDTIAEGLVFDAKDNLIEAVFSNVFLIKNNEIFTPDLSEAGVAGVMRHFLIHDAAPKNNLAVHVKVLQRDHVFNADALFLCNSLYGIWPVANVVGEGAHTFPTHPLIKALQLTISEACASHTT